MDEPILDNRRPAEHAEMPSQNGLGTTGDLYTLQGYNLLEFQGNIDLSRGSYHDLPDVRTAQQQLYEMIGENQVVWCSQDRPMLNHEAGRFLHRIRVDDRDVVAIVDTFVWNHIIENERYIPASDHDGLRYDAGLSTNGDYEEALRAAEDEYLRQHLPANLWSAVVRTKVENDDVQVLVRFPFAFSKVVNVQQVTACREDQGHEWRRRPVLWPQRKQEDVLRYVAQDVQTTLEVATACESLGALRWIARSGKLRTMRLLEGWLTVEKALGLPVPNTSWMDEPWPRERFTGWMGETGMPQSQAQASSPPSELDAATVRTPGIDGLPLCHF